MGASLPYAQIVGPATVYVAPALEPEPTVGTTPAGNWVVLGPTEGEQSIKTDAANTYWSDNDHQGNVLARTPVAKVGYMFNLVNMLHAQVSRILNSAASVTTQVGPPATSKMPFKPGYVPGEYALLIVGSADSPYGIFPGQNYFPRGVFEKTLEFKRGKTTRIEVACEYQALEDDTQADADRLGWGRVQTS